MKLARALPGFAEILTMEMVFSIGIIFAVIGTLLPGYRISTEKAHLSKIMSLVGNEIPERMISMALTGEVLVSDATPLPASWYDSEPKVGEAAVKKRVTGGGIRYEGRMGEPFFLTFTPSVAAEGPIGSVMWLCGDNAAPPGWTQPPQPGTDLPPELIPFVCRD